MRASASNSEGLWGKLDRGPSGGSGERSRCSMVRGLFYCNYVRFYSLRGDRSRLERRGSIEVWLMFRSFDLLVWARQKSW